MKWAGPRRASSALLAAFFAATAVASEDGGNPLQQVIELMTSLQGKIIDEGEKGQKAYNDFTQWCSKSASGKTKEISDGKALKEELEAKIEKSTSDAEEAATQTSALTGSIATDEADLKAATLLRQKEKADFTALDAELTSVVNTLSRARTVIQTQLKTAGVASFLQRPTRGMQLFKSTLAEVVAAASMISEDDHAKLTALLDNSDSEGDSSQSITKADPAVVYSSHSKGILEVLENLQAKAEESQATARSNEQTTRLNFETFSTALQDKIASEKKDLENTKAAAARANEEKAQSTKQLESCNKDLKADEKNLADLQRDCMNRATNFAEEVATRKAEMEALAEAKKTVQDSSAGAAAASYSFIQMSRSSDRFASATKEAVHQLRLLAKRTNSAALAQLASRASSLAREGASTGADPFAKVRDLIEAMIYKLNRELKSEATTKKFCTTQSARNKASREERADDVEEKTTKLEEIASTIAKLQQDLKTLSKERSDLASSQVEMDRIRKEENTAFTETEADLKQGLTGVQRAITILRDYYGGSDQSASFLQAMNAAEGASSAPSSAGGPILRLLGIVEADFAKSLTEAQAAEQAAAEEYEKITTENRLTMATQEAEVKYKNEDIAKLRKSSSQIQSDRAESQQELDALNDYWTKLSKQCSAEVITYDKRQDQRKAEIQGLREAISTLTK